MDPNLVMDAEDEPDPKLNRITNTILSAAFAVHSALGPGYSEGVYESALAIELRERRIPFVRQVRFPVMYRGEQVGTRKVDLIVEDAVIVEVKSVESLNLLFVKQTVGYLKLTKRRLGLLINFNTVRLVDGIRRIAN